MAEFRTSLEEFMAAPGVENSSLVWRVHRTDKTVTLF